MRTAARYRAQFSKEVPNHIHNSPSSTDALLKPHKMASDGKQKPKRKHKNFAVGSDIEVTSDEDGFRGIWFPAKILALPSKSHKRQYFVQYKSLLAEENGSNLLTEYADRSFVRPALATEEGSEEVSFEVDDVVEAFHLDGWWVGVVVEVLAERRYRVCFNSPADELEFERSSLRVHMDWVDGQWIMPKKKEKDLSHTNFIALIDGIWVCSLQDPTLNIDAKINLSPGNSADMNECAEDLRSCQDEQIVPSERDNVDNRSTPLQTEQATDVHSPQDSKIKATMPEGLKDQLPANSDIHASDNYHNMEDNASNGISPISLTKMVRTTKREIIGKLNERILLHKKLLERKLDISVEASIRKTLKSLTDELNYVSSTNKKPSSKRKRQQNLFDAQDPETRTPRKPTAETGKDTLDKENATEHEEDDFIDEGTPLGSLKTQDKSNVDDAKGLNGGDETLRKSKRQRKSVYESCILALQPVARKPRTIIEPLSSSQESKVSPNSAAETEANPKWIAEPQPNSNGGVGVINGNDKPSSTLFADSWYSTAAETEANPKWIAEPQPNSNGGGGVINGVDKPLSTLFADSRYSTESEGNDSGDSGFHVPIETIIATKQSPFAKTSPLWKVLEEMEVFQQIPQNPHFKPLYNNDVKEDSKEGLAIGYMVTFSNLVHKISRLGAGDRKGLLYESLDTLTELENHGFEVEPIRARLTQLISVKEKYDCSKKDLKWKKHKIVRDQIKKADADEEIKRLDSMIAELMMKRDCAVRLIEEKEQEIEELESNMESVKGVVEACQEEFELLVKKPW